MSFSNDQVPKGGGTSQTSIGQSIGKQPSSPRGLVNTHLTAYDSHLVLSMLIKSLSALNTPLHHPVFLLLHFLFPIKKFRASLNINYLSNQMSISISHLANKITASFEIPFIGLLTNYALINSYGNYFCPIC